MESKEQLSIRSGLAADAPGEAVAAQKRVEGVLAALHRAHGAYRIYGPESPATLRTLTKLRGDFAELWAFESVLALEVREGRFLWNGTDVFQSDSRHDSLPFLLYKEGIRELAFFPGFENGENERFLDTLHHARHEQAETDDLQTLLWERDFSCFHYGVASAVVDDDAALPSSLENAEPPRFARILAAEVDGEAQPTEPMETAVPAPTQEETPAAVQVPRSERSMAPPLDAEDWAYVQQQLAEEMDRDVSKAVVHALLDSLEAAAQGTGAEIIAILGELLRHLLDRRQLQSAAEMLAQLRSMLDRPEGLREDQRGAIRGLLHEMSAWSEVERFFRELEIGALLPDREELELFFDHLTGDALARLLQVAMRLQDQGLRRVVERRVERIAKADPEALLELLGCEDIEVVCRALNMIGAFQNDAFASRVLPLLAHPEARVRLAAVTALSNLDSLAPSDEFCAALHDSAADVRIAATAGLAAHGHLSALPHLRGKLQQKEFGALATAESRGTLVAYAKLGQAESVPLLDWLLNKRRFLRHKMPPHVRVGAAQALTYIDHPDAQRALRKSLRDRNLVVQAVVRSALRHTR